MDAYIVDGLRTPIGSIGGSLSGIRADDLAALPLAALMAKFPQIDPAAIDEVLLGCANQAGEDNRNVARMAVLLAGLPNTIPAETVNRLCASGLSAVAAAARTIKTGEAQLMLAGGVEHMTRAPYVISKSGKAFGTDAKMFDSSFGWRFVNPKMEQLYGIDAMGETAENLVELMNISREEQDLFALQSQQKAFAASAFIAGEILPVELKDKKGAVTLFQHDEFAKASSTLDGLSNLRAAFRKNGTVTAGNASGLNDGAAALLLASTSALKTHNLTPMARIVAAAGSGLAPRIMGLGPTEASKLALSKAGLTLGDMDIIEINEAFAAQVIACRNVFGITDDDDRLNPHGGAIAMGHPLGMSGARLALTAARSLQFYKKRYALVTMCVGVGQGYAMVLERA